MTFTWPVSGTVSSGFDYKSSIYVGGQHAAIDIPASQGTAIRAVAAGTVVGDAWDQYSGYFIALSHAGGWRSTYRHLMSDAPPAAGQVIAQGQVIGYVGSTGLSTGPHLHFDLWNTAKQDTTAFYKNGWWAHDPEIYLEEEDMPTQAEFEALKARVDAIVNSGGALTLQQILDNIDIDPQGHLKVTQWLADAIAALLPPSASLPALKVRFPGATVSIPPVDIPVEPV